MSQTDVGCLEMDTAGDKIPVLMYAIACDSSLKGATMLIHKKLKVVDEIENTSHILLRRIGGGLTIDLKEFHWMKERLVGFSGEVAVTNGDGEVGMGFAITLKQAGANAAIAGIDHIYALQAWMEGNPVLELEDLVHEAHTLVKMIGKKKDIIINHMVHQMREMKDNPLHFNMMLPLETFTGVNIITIESQTEKKQPNLFTDELISLLELGKERATGDNEKKEQVVPKNQDEKVAELHPDQLGSKLTPINPARSRDREKEKTNGEKVSALRLFGFIALFWSFVVISCFKIVRLV